MLLSAVSAHAEQQPTITIEASKSLPRLDTSSCLTQLDATVALASEIRDDDGYLESRFAQLESQCPDLPHFAHNQGVLAAQAERWNEAINHLDRSLQLDPRASMTYRHLQEIFEHRAAQAYARALKTRIPARPPVLALQLSTHQNAETSLSEHRNTQFRTISTVEYEMFAWWQSIQNKKGIEDFYVHDFPINAIGLGTQKTYTTGMERIATRNRFYH